MPQQYQAAEEQREREEAERREREEREAEEARREAERAAQQEEDNAVDQAALEVQALVAEGKIAEEEQGGEIERRVKAWKDAKDGKTAGEVHDGAGGGVEEGPADAVMGADVESEDGEGASVKPEVVVPTRASIKAGKRKAEDAEDGDDEGGRVERDGDWPLRPVSGKVSRAQTTYTRRR